MGILLLIHPDRGDVVALHKGEGDLFAPLVRQGYRPVGPRAQAVADKILAQDTVT